VIRVAQEIGAEAIRHSRGGSPTGRRRRLIFVSVTGSDTPDGLVANRPRRHIAAHADLGSLRRGACIVGLITCGLP
jgi:hypothetical protein